MTISIKIKEIMNNMPDTLNTKKEIDTYYKEAMKNTLDNNKLLKDNKPKKELNPYQKFMKENIKNIKEQNPTLTGAEVFSKIANMWKNQKEKTVNVINSDTEVVKDTKKETNENIVDDISEIKEAKEETKEVKKKEKKVK
jgi:hypothetical protein